MAFLLQKLSTQNLTKKALIADSYWKVIGHPTTYKTLFQRLNRDLAIQQKKNVAVFRELLPILGCIIFSSALFFRPFTGYVC